MVLFEIVIFVLLCFLAGSIGYSHFGLIGLIVGVAFCFLGVTIGKLAQDDDDWMH